MKNMPDESIDIVVTSPRCLHWSDCANTEGKKSNQRTYNETEKTNLKKATDEHKQRLGFQLQLSELSEDIHLKHFENLGLQHYLANKPTNP